jgi:hypothetical protein
MSSTGNRHVWRQPRPVPLLTVAVGASIALVLTVAFVAVSAGVSPWIGMGAIGGAIVSLSMFLSPVVSLAAVALSLPLERLGRLTEDFSSFTISLSRFVGLLALIALLFYAFIRRKKLHFGLPFWLYAGYVMIAALGIIWALAEKDAIRDSGRVLGNLLFFFLIVNLVRNMKMARIGILLWLLGTVGSGVYAIYGYHFGGEQEAVEEDEMGATSQRFTAVVEDNSETAVLGTKVKRVYGTTSHPGVFGLNLVMTLPFFAWVFRRERVIGKTLALVGFAIVCYCIFLSNTRAVFLLAGITLLLTVARGIWNLRIYALAGILLAMLCAMPFIPQDVYLRSLDPSLYFADKSDSIRIRFKMLDKSFELLQKHWVLGIGIGNQTIIPEMITDEPGGRITPDGVKASAHNEFVWSMVETGLFGWLLHWSFVVMVIAASFKAAKRYRQLPEAQDEYWLMLAAQIMLIVVVLFGVQTEVFHFSLKGWWFIAGISWALWETSKHEQGPELQEAA